MVKHLKSKKHLENTGSGIPSTENCDKYEYNTRSKTPSELENKRSKESPEKHLELDNENCEKYEYNTRSKMPSELENKIKESTEKHLPNPDSNGNEKDDVTPSGSLPTSKETPQHTEVILTQKFLLAIYSFKIHF